MSKRNKTIYWVATLWLAAGMVATGVQQLMHLPLEQVPSPPGAYGMAKLGYPVYLLSILGVAKLLGIVVLLIPRHPLLKEWAYAGFTILLTGAIWSHLAVGNAAADLFPASFLLVMLALSWWFRPAERKIAASRP